MDTLKTIWEDFSDRFKSPFVISFLLSWFVWNWLLVYSVFNFDTSWSMYSKQTYIEQYINAHKYCSLSLCPLASSIIVALFFYFFKAIFLAMDSLYENRIRVLVIKLIGVSKMVPSSDFERYSNEISLLNKELNDKKVLFESSQTDLKRLQELSTQYSDYDLIKNEKERLENISKSFKVEVKNLGEVFFGNWNCEYQFQPNDITLDITSGIEKFSMDGSSYYVGNDLVFIVSNVFRYENNVIEFDKRRLKNQFEITKTTLVNVYKDYWLGFEINNENQYSFVRYYPQNNIPDHLLYWFKKQQLPSKRMAIIQQLSDFAKDFKEL